MIELFDLAGAAPAALAAIQGELESLHNLGDILSWARTLAPPVNAPTVVTQDEYTHDVLVPWGDALTLAFDVT